MIIPHTEIETNTLLALIEEIVTRDGTDYGENELSKSTKVRQVMQQLELNEIYIMYSELHDTCSLMTKETFSKG